MSQLLYRVVAGSRLYGTNVETSDYDYGEVHIEKLENVFGIGSQGEMGQKIEDDADTQRHWFRKFCTYAMGGNPNVIEWLFVPADKVSHFHIAFNPIIQNRNLFLTADRIVASHMGFAQQQIAKMTVTTGSWGAERRALVEKYGYDTKFASHAIRLLNQLQCLWVDGEIRFPYHSHTAEMILEVRNGAYSKEEFLEFYKDFLAITRTIVVNQPHPNIQKKQDYAALAEVMKRVYLGFWGERCSDNEKLGVHL